MLRGHRARRRYLLERVLGLGHEALVHQRRVIDRRALGGAVERADLDDAVLGLRVRHAHRATHKLGQAAVERDLAALEARPRPTARTRFLAAGAEAARRALTSRDAATLA
eukprot:5535704-Prymnesium_polylepis.1